MAVASDIVIVGGGVIGLTTAYVLAKEGLRVTVLDRQEFGQEASWAGAGILPSGDPAHAVSPFDRLALHKFAALFPTLSGELRERTGIDNGYVRCGGLEFANSDTAALPEEWRGSGVSFQTLTEDQTRRLEPALAQRLGSAYLLPELAQLRNPRHVKALIAACAKLKVYLRPHCAARSFEMRDQRINGIRTDQETFAADKHVLATGAWTDPVLAEIGWRLDVHPVRGQIALLNPGAPLFHHVLMCGARYLVPRIDGRILVGSTEEHVGCNAQTTVSAQQELLNFACRLVPGLAEAALEPLVGGVAARQPGWAAIHRLRSRLRQSAGRRRSLPRGHTTFAGNSANPPRDHPRSSADNTD